MVALERANILVSEYHAFEIDKYAIQVSEKNYPGIKRYGSVVGADFSQFKGADLLIGGSPCQDLSIAKTNRQGLDGAKSGLFWEYVRALKEIQPTYFLLENVASMTKENKRIISEAVGVEPILINSSLVSAQQRKRLYWTNIQGIEQPQDQGIFLRDILENGCDIDNKSETIKSQYGKNAPSNYFRSGGFKATMIFEPVARTEKSRTITAAYRKHSTRDFIKDVETNGQLGSTGVFEPVCVAQRGRYIESGNRSKKVEGGTQQHLEHRLDGKTNTLSAVQKDNMICEPIRIGDIGSNAQAHRVYSVQGKSVCINSGHAGNARENTGLYKVDLPDGDYIIRKLTPIECERLQTLDDDYTKWGLIEWAEGISKKYKKAFEKGLIRTGKTPQELIIQISNTQRYKCIGNG
jgi:DNA-cytosine methyltransferase